MPVDASIYSNAQVPAPVNPMQSVETALKMSNMAMQQQQMGYQMQQQGAIRGALARNTDTQTGQLDRASFLSDLGHSAPQAKMQMESQFAEQDKNAAQAKLAQMQQAHSIASIVEPAMNYMINQVPKDQQATVWPAIHKQLSDQGVPMQNAAPPDQWDPALGKQQWLMARNTKEGLDNALVQAQVAKTYSEVGQTEKTRLTEYQKMLAGDETYKKSQGMLNEGKNAFAAIDDATKNPGSATNVPIMLARFTTAGQRINETELEAQIKAGSWGDQMKQMMLKGKEGTLSQDLADYSRQFLATQMQSAARNKANAEYDIAGKYAIDAGLKKTDAYHRLTGTPAGTMAPVPAGPARFQGPQNTTSPLAGSSPATAAPPLDLSPKPSGFPNMGGPASASANETMPVSAPALAKRALPPGMIRIIDDKGVPRIIPAALKGEAIAAGGKLVK